MMELPLPKEAKAALNLAPELMRHLQKISDTLEELLELERQRQ